MEPVTAIRAHLPPPVSQPAPERVPGAAAAQTPPPVTATVLADALRQPARLTSLPALDPAKTGEDAEPARAAAEAARKAYIRASLAAGISPLPLSGA